MAEIKNTKRSDSKRIKEASQTESILGINPFPEGSARTELVFGLVGPTGVDLKQVSESLQEHLKSFGYSVYEIRLSDLIPKFVRKSRPEYSNEYDRISKLMTDGTKLRERTRQADIVARLGIVEIRRKRRTNTNDERQPPTEGAAYIVRSFKRPEEVELFRTIYGKAFNLISVFSPRQQRIDHLKQKFAAENGAGGKSPEEKAIQLINRDFREDAKLGQKVSKTYPLADFFLSNDNNKNISAQIGRLVQLVFGYPYISPTKDEQGIFFAHAAAMRSLDLSRQVGAAITNEDGDIISTGCNEVPKFGGGLYWGSDAGVSRDFELGEDANIRIKSELIQDFFIHLKEKKWLTKTLLKAPINDITKSALNDDEGPFLRDAKIFDVIEFGRAVHGEMAAITQAAKLGIKLQNTSLFCTTFPCHLCARHIVSSGIREVIFIEPYEKSRTGELYRDSIAIEPHENINGKAIFRSFVGVSPRRYIDFFSMTGERKSPDGTVLDFEPIKKAPRISRPVLTYLFLEDTVILQTKQFL